MDKEMRVDVNMSAEDFLDFVRWQKDHETNSKKIQRLRDDILLLCQTVGWAIAQDPTRSGRYKISSQDHLDDLWNLAASYLNP